MNQYFGLEWNGSPFVLFSMPHLIALAFVALINVALIVAGNRLSQQHRKVVRYGLAAILVVDELLWHVWNATTGQWTIQRMLPLHLCSVLVWLSAVMLVRKSYPIYEVAFRLAGSGLQERIWRHVLSSLAAELGVQADVDVEKACLDTTLQWSGVKNVRYNAQIRTIVYVVLTWPLRAVRGRNRRREGSTRHA